jgi:hypothetical protein
LIVRAVSKGLLAFSRELRASSYELKLGPIS